MSDPQTPDVMCDGDGECFRLADKLADAEQQLEVLRPGGRYAWKTRAEAAEAELATVTDRANAENERIYALLEADKAELRACIAALEARLAERANG